MVEVYKVKLPVYGVFLAFVIPAVYMIPCRIIEGITNVNANQINVLAEFIGGYIFHGTPLANMVFKVLSQDVVGQGVGALPRYTAHIMILILYQLYFAQAGNWDITSKSLRGRCWATSKTSAATIKAMGFPVSRANSLLLICRLGRHWPNRLYSAGKIYSGLLHFFWIGALMPVLTWCIWKGTKNNFWRKVNWPLIYVGTYNVPPATGINYSSWALVNFIFNHIIYRKFFAWWTKYNSFSPPH